MQIKHGNIEMESMNTEKGFTFLELIFVMLVTGIISSTLILPFSSSIKHGTRPEIYNTATYLAVEVMEEYRSTGYPNVVINSSTLIGDPVSPVWPDVTKKGRTYSLDIRAGYVDDPSDTSLDTTTTTEYIKVQVTVSNSDIPNDVVLWEILTEDFYDANAN